VRKTTKVIAWMIIGFIAHLFAARPFATDDAGTVSPGKYEPKLDYEFGKEEGILTRWLGIFKGYLFFPQIRLPFRKYRLKL